MYLGSKSRVLHQRVKTCECVRSCWTRYPGMLTNQTAHVSFRSWFEISHVSSQWLHMAQLLDWFELHDTVQPCTLRKDVKEPTVQLRWRSWVFADIRPTTSRAAPPKPIGHLRACLKILTRPITAIKFAKSWMGLLDFMIMMYVWSLEIFSLHALWIHTMAQKDVNQYWFIHISKDNTITEIYRYLMTCLCIIILAFFSQGIFTSEGFPIDCIARSRHRSHWIAQHFGCKHRDPEVPIAVQHEGSPSKMREDMWRCVKMREGRKFKHV